MASLADVNLNRLAVLVSVVEAGSITAAARRLGIAKAMVSAHVQRLEKEVGASLLLRTTRSLSLTEAGEAFFEAARRIVQEAEHAVAQAASASTEPRGTLRITSPIDYGATVIAPVAAALQQRHPSLKIELLSHDHVLDLVSEGLDVAVRIGRLGDSSYRAARIGGFVDTLVASPAFLKRWPAPKTPEGLAALPFVALSVLPSPAAWTFKRQASQVCPVRFAPVLSANTAYTVRNAALAGAGLAILPDFAVARDLADGTLVHVLPQWKLPSGGIHALFASTRTPPRKVKVLIDALKAHAATVHG